MIYSPFVVPAMKKHTRTKIQGRQFLEAQSTKYALDKLCSSVPLSQIENNPKYATQFKYPSQIQSERQQWLRLAERLLAIIERNI
jgi:hypothetical protein